VAASVTDWILRCTDKDGVDVWIATANDWKLAYAHLCAWQDQGRFNISLNGVPFDRTKTKE
jgi:hypothetical protein